MSSAGRNHHYRDFNMAVRSDGALLIRRDVVTGAVTCKVLLVKRHDTLSLRYFIITDVTLAVHVTRPILGYFNAAWPVC